MSLFKGRLKSNIDASQVSDVEVSINKLQIDKTMFKNNKTTIIKIIKEKRRAKWWKTHSIETEYTDFDASIRWVISPKTMNLIVITPYVIHEFGGNTTIKLIRARQCFGGNTTTIYPYVVYENSLNIS